MKGICIDPGAYRLTKGKTYELMATETGDPKEHVDVIDNSGYRKRSEEHTSELHSHSDLVCRLLLEKKNKKHKK